MNTTKRTVIISVIAIATVYILSGFCIPTINTTRIEHHQYLIDKNGIPTKPLHTLLQVTNISHDNSLASIVQATQKEQPIGWLRPAGKEWQVDEIFDSQRDVLMHAFDELGCLQEIRPTQRKYTYAIILGATLARTRTRLKNLVDLWNEGIRFDYIIVLGGQRPLDPAIEPFEHLINKNNSVLSFKHDWVFTGDKPTTELSMMKIVFEQSELPWHNIPIIFVDTPMQQTSNGLRRPTTEDTIRAWLAQNPTPGSIVAISNQPYIAYQDAVLRLVLPSTFTIETVGHKSSERSLAVLLDNMARWLYQEHKRRSILA